MLILHRLSYNRCRMFNILRRSFATVVENIFPFYVVTRIPGAESLICGSGCNYHGLLSAQSFFLTKKGIKEVASIFVLNNIIFVKQEDANVCLLEGDPPQM
ncbi:hypothetical protein AAZV13_04G123832 [Glycine max]